MVRVETRSNTVMKRSLASLPPRPVKTVLIGIYVIALAMALVPPLYFSASGSSILFLGIPGSIAYWILNALLVGVALGFLYVY